jgi:hypothetical protein
MVIGPTDWLDGKKILSDKNCEYLGEWAMSYENNWHRHDDLKYLREFDPGTESERKRLP